MTVKKPSLGLWIWLSVVSFYLYQYILRVSPGIMARDIISHFSIDANTFGLLSALATYMYAGFQIPAGILSDFFGTRRMILISIFLCISGVFLLSFTDYLMFAYGARILMGAGSACAFLCISKVISDWFAPEKKTFYFSLTITAGTMGALLGGKPLAFFCSTYGWQYVLLFLGFGGIFIFLLNYKLLRDPPSLISSPPCRTSLKKDIMSVFKNKNCWTYALIATGLYLCMSVFADLWGVSFLMLKLTVERETAAELISLIYIGSCVGSLTICTITRSLTSIKNILFLGAVLLSVILSLLIYSPHLTYETAALLLFSMGLMTGVEILCFICACQSMPIAVAATVTGFVNSIVTLGGAFLQQQVGFVLDYLSDKTVSLDGTPAYTLNDYEGALSLLIVASLGAALLLAIQLIKEWAISFRTSS